MEPRGCNRWQPVANGARAKSAQPSQNRCRALRSGLRGASLARNLQGSSLQKAAIAAGEGADLDAVVEDASNKPP
jgi:hypothetical protein